MTIARIYYLADDGKVIERVPFESEETLSEQIDVEIKNKVSIKVSFTVDNDGNTFVRKPFIDSISKVVKNIETESL